MYMAYALNDVLKHSANFKDTNRNVRNFWVNNTPFTF